MQTGLIISAAGHAGLLIWALVGWPIDPANEATEPEAVSVELISAETLEQLTNPTPPAAPEMVTELAALPPAAATAPIPLPLRPSLEAPPPDQLAPGQTLAAPPPPIERVAPVPVPPPPETVPEAPEPEEAVVPEPSPEVEDPAEEIREAAPEAAADRIVTEETETAPEPLPSTNNSPRPQLRPGRQLAAAPSEQDPQPDAEPEPEAAPALSLEDALDAALAEALATPVPEEVPSLSALNTPLTEGDKARFRVEVGRCWNFGSLSSEASEVVVTVGIDMTADARPVQNSIRMVSWQNGSEAAARQAFETARRAILRCGVNGYSLPREKYDQWREIVMTFSPRRMLQR